MKKLLMAAGCLALTTTSFIAANKSTQLVTDSKLTAVVNAGTDDKGEPQTFKTKFSNDKDNQIQLELYQSSVQVVGHNSDEVIIETTNYKVPERAQGLKSLFSQADDNTNLGLAVTKEKNTLKVTQATRRGGRYTIKVPRKVAIIYHATGPHGGKLNLSDTEGLVDIDLLHSSATLTNITGPVKAHSVHGRLDITFSELNQAKASTIQTVHAPVDITLPANTKADFELQATHGEIYTDFDLNRASTDKDGLTKIAGGNTIKGKTNNGGVEMNISAVHSDIFIRKKK